MFNKKMGRALALALSASMVVMGGCGSTSGETAANGGSEASAGEEAVQDAAQAQNSFEVATVRWGDWGEYYHALPDQLAEETGITITWDTILNSDWSDRKAVLLAGGDLPDAFMGSICFSESDIMTNLGSFIALDDYIDDYMPNLKKIMEEDPAMKSLATSADGHIYGLPAKRPCRPTVSNQMFINKVWLDNLGLDVPTTYTEFVDVLRAFKDQDANGNGDPSDEIPFGQGYADSVMFFCLPFGTTLGADGTYSMALKDGEPVYLPVTDNYKEGIKWMHECYEEGLIDVELFTQDSTMQNAKLMNEPAIVGTAPGWTADSTFYTNADEYIALPALTGPDGNAYISSDPEHWNYCRYEFVITTSCKDPGTLLSWVDKFYTEDASIQNYYGIFGLGVEKDEEAGTYTVLPPVDGNTADTNAWIHSLRDFGPKYVGEDFNDKVIYAEENGDASKLELDKEMKQYATEAYPNVSYTVDQLNTLATLYTDISTYVSTMQSTWLTEGGVDEQWDTYISTLEQMGFNDFMQIMTDAYNTYKANQ